MHAEDRQTVERFLATIQPLESAYVQGTFNYVALKKEGRLILSFGRLFLSTSDPKLPRIQLETEHVKAGRVKLTELGLTTQSFLETLIDAGAINIDGAEVHFAPDGLRCAATFIPYHPDGLTNQQRYSVLRLLAGTLPPIAQPDIDWELKAAATPYDGLTELLNELNLAGSGGPTCTVEVVAFNVAAIDAANSTVSGNTATISMALARTLDPRHAKIGYRVYSPGTLTQRGVIDASQITWTTEEIIQRGRAELSVPLTATVNCAAVYDGAAQAHYWISDPDRAQNPRRAVFETIDPKLERLKAALANATLRGQDARQMEPAIAWLAWMLGFSPVHLGGMPRTQDAADVLLSTPGGHYGVVECTTGLLKAENKLALLHARSEAVRTRLRETGNTVQRVLPIIISSRSRAELKPDIEAAERLRVLVLARENIEQGIERTLRAPNADQIFSEGEQAVQTASAKYEAQPALPLESFASTPP